MDSKTRNRDGASGSSMAAWVIFGVLTVVFAVSLVVRLMNGASALEVTDVIPWAGLIAFFFLLASIGGGLLIVSALIGFSIFPSLLVYQRNIAWGAVACLVAAGVMVLIDLGRPERVLNMLFHIHMASPFAWDFIFLALSVVLGFACAVFKPNRILACAAGISGAAVMVVEGIIFVVSSGREFWHSSSIPLLFLLEGVIAGFAIVAFASSRGDGKLVRALAVLLAVLLAFNVVEWVYAYMPFTGAAEDLALLTTGPLAPLYWFQLIVCTVLPLVLLVAVPRSAIVRASSVLVLIGIVAAKFTILLAGQSVDVMGIFQPYAPSLLEIGLSLGGLGFAGLLYLVGAKILLLGLGKTAPVEAGMGEA